MSTSEELKQRGNTEFAACRFQEALALYEQAAALDPQNVDLLNNAAAANFSLKRYDEAIACAQRSLRIRDNCKAHLRMGAALWAMNRLVEAHLEYERAAALSPGNADIEHNLQSLRRLLHHRPQQPPASAGTTGLFVDVAVGALAAITVFCQFFARALSYNAWVLLLLAAVGQQGLTAHRQGLVRLTSAALSQWRNHRCTLETLLCITALLTRTEPQTLMACMLGLFSLMSIAMNQTTLENIAPAAYRFLAPHLQKIVANGDILLCYTVTLEAFMLFTVMFTAGGIFTLAYIQYIKNLYRIDSNMRLAFTGIRMNLSHLTRNRYVPVFVDTCMQKTCDMLYQVAMHGT